MAPLVVDIVDLPAQIGAMKNVTGSMPAPAQLGTEMIAVPEGSPIDLDLTLTSVEDGVLVHGRAHVTLHGECVRCLGDIDDERSLSLSELYLSPQAAAAQQAEGDEEAEDFFLLGETTLDLEPALRDALVLDLPFQPLCQPDCQGLCPDCGERLDDLPEDHHHEVIDARWSALTALLTEEEGEDAPPAQGAASEKKEGK